MSLLQRSRRLCRVPITMEHEVEAAVVEVLEVTEENMETLADKMSDNPN